MNTNATAVRNALNNNLTVPSFNIPYPPMMEPVIRAVCDEDAFAFIAVARIEWEKLGAISPAVIAGEFHEYEDPRHVSLHLDHVPVIDEDDLQVDWEPIFRQGIEHGYQSLMIDGSRLDLEGNIEVTRRAVEIAHSAGLPCEAELGAVMGHEDGPQPPYEELFRTKMGFTDIEQARRFVAETGCDWLSVAVGSIHGSVRGAGGGAEKVEARLDLEHIERLQEATGVPLVLHGGSGINREYAQGGIRRGIAKVNVASEIRRAYVGEIETSGDEQAACELVYERTRSLLHDYFALTGTRSAIIGEGG